MTSFTRQREDSGCTCSSVLSIPRRAAGLALFLGSWLLLMLLMMAVIADYDHYDLDYEYYSYDDDHNN